MNEPNLKDWLTKPQGLIDGKQIRLFDETYAVSDVNICIKGIPVFSLCVAKTENFRGYRWLGERFPRSGEFVWPRSRVIPTVTLWTSFYIPHRIHVWYIYLHLVVFVMVNVGKYTIHGSYGFYILSTSKYPGRFLEAKNQTAMFMFITKAQTCTFAGFGL